MAEAVASNMRVLDNPVGVLDAPVTSIEREEVRQKLRFDRSAGRLPLSVVRPDAQQVRTVDTTGESFQELVASVREHGVIQPVTVRYVEQGDFFQIITGERRYRASVEAGLADIPAVVRDVDDTGKAIHQLVENLQRENMNPVEEAAAFRRYLTATGGTQEQLATRIGKSNGYISQILSIDAGLSLEERETLAKVSPAKLPGRSLIYEAIKSPDPEIRAAVLSGRLTRAQARGALGPKPPKASAATPRARVFSQSFTVESPSAVVTVRFDSPSATADEVLAALDRARQEAKRALRNG